MPGCILASKGGSHTARERENVSPKGVGETVGTDLDVVRKMATRDGDDASTRVRHTQATDRKRQAWTNSPSRWHATVTASMDMRARWRTRTC